jgi:hypothetical protein
MNTDQRYPDLTMTPLRPLFGGILLSLTACDDFATRTPEILWAPPDATFTTDGMTTAGPRGYDDGSADMRFTIATRDFNRVSTELIDHFAREGWRQSATEWLNPGLESSFQTGWRHICACIRQRGPDGKPIKAPLMYEWSGEWQDRRGDGVSYRLLAVDDRIHGYAAYVPARNIREFTRTHSRVPTTNSVRFTSSDE